jgi:cell division protein FtsB
MQHSQDTINNFIELRARSLPYSRIAADLNITKATAVRWGGKYKAEIDALAAVEAEALRDKFFAGREKEIETLAKRLQRLETEIDKRNPEFMPTRELTELARVTRARLDALCVEPTLPEDPAPATANLAA